MGVESPEILEAVQELVVLVNSLYSWLKKFGHWCQGLLGIAIAILLLMLVVKFIKLFM